MKNLGKRWRIFSREDIRYLIDGYTDKENDYEDEAIKATLSLSKHLNISVPVDIQLVIIGTDQ